MKLGKSNWLIAIVLTCVLLTTGCAEFSRNGETASTKEQEPPLAEQPWGRSTQPASSKKKSSFFFNDKSREIEASLGI